MKIIAQIIGILGTISLFFMYRQSSKKKYILLKLLSETLWAIHYFLLSAIGGAIPNLVGIAREIVFMNDNKKWANKKVWAAIFIAINWTIALILLKSAIQIIPICVSSLVTISFTFKKTSNIRLVAIPVCTTMLIYDILVGSWSGVLNESLSLISIIPKTILEHKNHNNKGNSAQ